MKALLYCMRLDAALCEWKHSRDKEVAVVGPGRCDVCLLVKNTLHRRGYKQICLDCGRVELKAVFTGNVRSLIPLGDFLYEVWNGGAKPDLGDTDAWLRLAEPRKAEPRRNAR